MKIQLKVNDRIVTARIIDGPTARDFIKLLPLTLTMNDLFKREKFGSLPRAIASGGKHTHSYALGVGLEFLDEGAGESRQSTPLEISEEQS
jgi:hypothetical protein